MGAQADKKNPGPHIYSPDELDVLDKEAARKMQDVDRLLAKDSLEELQTHGIQNGKAQVGRIDNLFFNHKILQPPKTKTRRHIIIGTLIIFVLLFIIWDTGL